MNYYRISVEIESRSLPFSETEIRRDGKCAKDIRDKIADYNKNNPGAIFLISDIDDDDLLIAAISFNKIITGEDVCDFCSHLGIPYFFVSVEEVVLETLKEMLDVSNKRHYSDKKVSEVLKSLDIEPLRRGDDGDIRYEECLIDGNMKKKEIIKSADGLLFFKSLKSEFDRIYGGADTACVFGHPVHYMIETDGEAKTARISSLLLSALYSKGRVKSKKYGYIEFQQSKSYSRDYYESVYKSCTGGTVVVSFENCGGKMPDAALIKLCNETLMKYRHKVLTVFCVPGKYEGIRNRMLSSLENIKFVEIFENDINAKTARKYLKERAAHRGIKADKKLYEKLDQDKRFCQSELNKTFDGWYDEKLKRSVYPQYKNVSLKNEAHKTAGQLSALDELNGMIGLDEAKKTIAGALSYYKIQNLYKKFGVAHDEPAMHMVFTGNPGTAKTTAARLFAKIMKENGVLPSGHLVEVGRADLVGRYVGWTARIVKEKFEEARGGILFIDEAYSLTDGGEDENKNSFGIEAINTIVQEMENNRDELIVIFAGYPDEMKKFLSKNPGLRSRVAFHIYFPDYSTEELCEIARSIGRSKDMTITDGAMEKLARLFESAKVDGDFGNGRFVRNMIEKAGMNLAERVLGMDPDSITKDILTTIEVEDVDLPKIRKISPPRRVGFSA